MYNKKKYTGAYTRGKNAENKFAIMAKERDFDIVKSSVKKDKEEHWDFEISKQLTHGFYKRKFDIKAMKKVNGEYTDELIYIELQNVGGTAGWLYGKQDGVVFEMKESFILVNLEDLRKKVESLVDVNAPSVPTVSNKKPYVIYDRKRWDNNDDRMLLITKEDLLSVPHTEWKFK